MNATTQLEVNKILKDKFYRQGKTLGDGGWNRIPTNWPKYTLFMEGSPIDHIKAQEDYVAIDAFNSIYDLHDIQWAIVKSETTYTTILDSEMEINND